ncbi:MAG: redoxin domain-containing protein, partial [Bacteroidales bacterium]|nr:redoxin domain-containing protein [Bacteroidales bacterium]
KLEEYVKALERQGAEVKSQECDFILETVTLQEIRDHAARKLYAHYRHSPVMGDEAVAIHLFDRWFSPGKVSFEHNDEFSEAQVFADFNRSSLIGMQAPPLTLLAPDGTPLDFPADNGRPKILYFYDTECASCKITTPVLKRYLDEHPCEADLYAVYVGDSEKDWKKARKNDFLTDAIHAWDPELRSDFQRLYGVLTTPKLFLIAPDGTILGRCLDVPALHLLLVRNHVGGVATPLVDEGGHVGGQR